MEKLNLSVCGISQIDTGFDLKWIYLDSSWVTKNGSKKTLQYWVYCESNHDNFLRYNLRVPGLNITSNSRISKNSLTGNLFVVEDILDQSEYKKVFPLLCTSPTVSWLHNSLLIPLEPKDISFNLTVISDDDFPKHPLQETFSSALSTMSFPEEFLFTQFPFNFTVKLNFRGRAEGWFKIQTNLMYEGELITQNISEPFIFNNPRIKKMKEHRDYTSGELKFMQIATLVSNKEEYLEQYGYLYENAEELISQSTKLFPPKQK